VLGKRATKKATIVDNWALAEALSAMADVKRRLDKHTEVRCAVGQPDSAVD
jgi:hypothetical protein